MIKHTKTKETNNPYTYTGREYDSEELYYYRARYYDPTIQRFLSEDPIGFASGDFNFYRYVGDNPVNFVDPSGEFLQYVIIGLGTAWGIYEFYQKVKVYFDFAKNTSNNFSGKQKEEKNCSAIKDLIKRYECYDKVRKKYLYKQINDTCTFGKEVTPDIKTLRYK
ncbi:RHS repeat-associated core domain-containing protein [Caminibacter pacificus]|uniref:RHS repeat-associated core domain-containing protein n=1 Tax=Caminibacter pacificus TaxID=1424653 RepID=A0ABX5TNN4_9BACT|nr:RHS repeat-associated core domain-containing protein [Caminibacter pacificus]